MRRRAGGRRTSTAVVVRGFRLMALIAAALLWLPAVGHAAADANEPSCVNETAVGFRSTLPDCRAYEMVSPPYKDGFSIQGGPTLSEGSAGGAPLVAAGSLGAFAGGPDIITVGNDYEFERTEAGWQTAPLEPQPEQFYVVPGVAPSDERGRLAISEDGAALFVLHTPLESAYAANLYRREADGAFQEIGPMLPQSAVPAGPTGLRSFTATFAEDLHFAGASPGLNRVMFYTGAGEELPEGVATNLWPGDATVLGSDRFSLYEYPGIGHSDPPRLVGVDSAGRQVSQCGATLGGPPARQGNTDNAISADGQTVFFTALKGGCTGHNELGEPLTGTGPASDQLFARSGSESTSISVPTSECGVPCEGLPAADANFEGASQSGDIAVFSSTEKLLPEAVEDSGEHESGGELLPDDAVENGGCRTASADGGCNLYGYDKAAPAGHRLFLVSTGANGGAHVQGVAGMSADGSRVFFVATAKLSGANREGRAPVDGGENLYVYTRRCADAEPDCASPATSVVFVATLSESDQSQWSQTGEAPMDVTPDGDYLVFTSRADITPDDTSTVRQVFRYDADSATLVRVSIGNDGFNDDGNTTTPGLGAGIQGPSFSGALEPGVDPHPSVSGDGSIVVFDSPLALTPGALEARSELNPLGETTYAKNVYEYEDGHVYLISDGRSATGVPLAFLGSLLIGVSDDGRDVFFRTYGSLLPQDTDSLVDIYDARAGGGFPGPVGASGACEGSACQDPVAAGSSLPEAGSIGQQPGGNLASAGASPRRPETNAQRLAAALRVCRSKKHRRPRSACEQTARRRYLTKHGAPKKKARSKKR